MDSTDSIFLEPDLDDELTNFDTGHEDGHNDFDGNAPPDADTLSNTASDDSDNMVHQAAGRDQISLDTLKTREIEALLRSLLPDHTGNADANEVITEANTRFNRYIAFVSIVWANYEESQSQRDRNYIQMVYQVHDGFFKALTTTVFLLRLTMSSSTFQLACLPQAFHCQAYKDLIEIGSVIGQIQIS
ncbi:hypothetical protein BDP27DRAFT_1361207 [Rhodocollybia butyracea]|uniref:Uncharacterized protein n=1 Tax=Rhodocollybia butyracea TaxID=206335 RepID=A0A9P5UBI5_9AGAR|nr:hypothetical protein BDP27DRAFT_1361207 [Rhodocollybia butyracea]